MSIFKRILIYRGETLLLPEVMANAVPAVYFPLDFSAHWFLRDQTFKY